MKRDALRVVVAAALIVGLGGGIAGGIEVRPLEGAETSAVPDGRSTAAATLDDGTTIEGPLALESGGPGESDWPSLVAPATDGTYNGNVGGQPFTLTVSGNKITNWKAQNLICPDFTIVQASVTTNCNIAGNDSFTCGGLGCSGVGLNMRIAGSFSGQAVNGTLDLDLRPTPFDSCCSLRNLAFSATTTGGSVPSAPSNLAATAISDDRIDITWQDNSNNETEFRVEGRQGTSGSFTDLGSVGANPDSSTGATITSLDPATLYQFRVRAHNANGYSPYSNTASATTLGGSTGPCVPTATALCLNNDRFKVEATFRTNGQPAASQAQVIELTADTGYLWFFNANNVEVVVKVLNACNPATGSKYWVFAAGLTNVEVNITVTDTQTGAVKTYPSPLNTPFQPLQDTNAFATCP